MMKSYAFLNKVVQERIGGFFSHGYANGYVAIPPEHPLYGEDYEKVNQKVSVWGGLTYGEPMSVLLENGWKDDEAHGLVECIGFGSLDEIPKDYYVYGFDTMHASDSPSHNRDWCIHETLNLQEQLMLIKG